MLGRLLLLCGLFAAAAPAAALTIYKYTDANGVVTYSDRAVAGAQVFVFRDRMVERLEREVKLETKKHAGGETLQVRNDLYAPVEVGFAHPQPAQCRRGARRADPLGGPGAQPGAPGDPGAAQGRQADELHAEAALRAR